MLEGGREVCVHVSRGADSSGGVKILVSGFVVVESGMVGVCVERKIMGRQRCEDIRVN